MIKKMKSTPQCGDIWMCDLPSRNGSTQNGFRPVFILSNNMNNTYSTTLNVIPLTSKMNKKKLPVHVELWDYQEYGLKKPSTMLIEQITTVSTDNLSSFIGCIKDSNTLMSVRKAMNIQFPLLQCLS